MSSKSQLEAVFLRSILVTVRNVASESARSDRNTLKSIIQIVNDALVSTNFTATPEDQQKEADSRTIKSLATMLGWANVPPRESLERSLNELKDRVESADGKRVALAEENEQLRRRNERQAEKIKATPSAVLHSIASILSAPLECGHPLDCWDENDSLCMWCVDLAETKALKAVGDLPIPLLLLCPECAERHIDEGDFATKKHHTHACQYCGHVWRPAVLNTVGVQFLPGFKDKVE